KPKRFGSAPPSPKPTQPEEEGVTSDDDEGEESPEIEDSESPAPEDSEFPEPEDKLQQQLHQEAEETEQLSQARTLADSIRAELEQQFAIQFAKFLDKQGILHHFPDVEAELEHSSDRKEKQRDTKQPRTPSPELPKPPKPSS